MARWNGNVSNKVAAGRDVDAGEKTRHGAG
jgi:hypothetical protein